MVKAELKQACESANSADEILQAFQKMDCNETDLGIACLKLAYEFHEQGHHPEKILCLGRKGLKTLIEIVKNNTTNRSYSLIIARLLHLLGHVCHQLEKFSESICYLNWAVRNLVNRLENVRDDRSCSNQAIDVVYDVLSDVHFELSGVKRAIGRIDEAGYHLRKALEMGRGKFGVEIGMASQRVGEECEGARKFEEALSFFLKAEEVYMKQFRPDLGLLMKVRWSIAVVCFELGECEKALEVNRVRLSVLRRMDCVCMDLIEAELLDANILMSLDRCEEALEGLKGVVSRCEVIEAEGARAAAFALMAKGCCIQEKFSEAKRYLRIALRITEKKNMDSDKLVAVLNQASFLYEHMEEFESAIPLLRRLLAVPNLSENFLVDFSERLFEMVNQSGNDKQVMWLEDVMERLIKSFGTCHFYVGFGYVRFGAFYVNFGRPDMAAKYLALAKCIMDVCLSPDQPDSLVMGHDLSMSYAAMGSYSLAIECEEKVVKVLEGLGPSHEDFLDEAVKMLNELKQKACEEGKG